MNGVSDICEASCDDPEQIVQSVMDDESFEVAASKCVYSAGVMTGSQWCFV